ncbi:aromatic amino acid transporter [Otariodibacter oris]|uniref:Aromatic amino acid permease n=1 Tax=Otariodibacter oris TaxID=1032623 RepID=A0A420XG47_9PAST|nr:aromatic amino acid transporter [Otariodibacter oris]QGM80257.1 transposase [Otariodibacter oris]RKR71623.1 tryptophan-specific transport protein [Otariodibacter oris]
MSKQPSIFGGAAIIASVCIGAGMLGLPTSGAGAWTVWSTIAITLTMVVMTLSGWLLLEAYKHYDTRASFNTATKNLLGSGANIINNISVYFVGGILLYAYTTASGNILSGLTESFFTLDSRYWSILFVLVFSFLVWHSTRVVDRISVLLVIFMALTFIFSTFGLTANIDINTLLDKTNLGSNDTNYGIYAMGLLPVALTSFGYHHSVATMRAYYGEERKAKLAILVGTGIALAIYLLWVLSIFGNLPRDQFAPIIAEDGNLDVLLAALNSVIESESVKHTLNAFSIAAILSSFIGVGLGVFDFLADFFKFDNTKSGRAKSWAVTFLPPLVLSVLFPLGFLKAIGYAGAAATIWTCIIPGLLAYKSRKLPDGEKGFKVAGGMFTIVLVIVFGIVTALFHFLSMFNVLPVFKG